MDRTHSRITAADVVAFTLTLAAFAGAVYCVLSALGSI
jgi:hypothetical protein